MLFLLALALAAALTLSCSKAIKKHAYVFYGAALVLAAVFGFVRFTGLPAWITKYVLGLFQRGALATALWVIVMFTGALPAKNALRKIWLPIRGQLSILAAILSLCHNATFGKIYFVALVNNTAALSATQLIAAVLSIVLLVIMIPLTVMSFPQVRRRMNAKLWKTIQKAAYVFYAALYIHIMLIMTPMARMGIVSYQIDVCIYSLVFLAYFIARITKAMAKGNAASEKSLRIIGAAVLVIAMIGVVMLVQPAKPSTTPAVTDPTETTAPVSETALPSESTVPGTKPKETTVPETTTGETTVPSTEETEDSGKETTEAAQGETEATEAETTAPAETKPSEPKETTSPAETTAPETTVPETTVPETTVPETTVPETTVPETTVPETTAEPRTYNDGVYSGSATGYEDPSGAVETITVTVTIQDDRIVDIQSSTSQSSTYFFNLARDGMVPTMIAAQSPYVDTVSGATYSSEGLIAAVESALAQARV